MAIFNKSLEVLLSWEGGYSFNPLDPGGETYCGISRKKWPSWMGWKFIDSAKTHGPLSWNWKSGDQGLNSLVYIFYKANYWNKESYNLLDNQDIADKIFQHHINMGTRAIRIAQNSVNGTIVPDSILGPIAVSSVNATDKDLFLERYCSKLIHYYHILIDEHPQLKVFEHEWLLRAKTIGKRP